MCFQTMLAGGMASVSSCITTGICLFVYHLRMLLFLLFLESPKGSFGKGTPTPHASHKPDNTEVGTYTQAKVEQEEHVESHVNL